MIERVDEKMKKHLTKNITNNIIRQDKTRQDKTRQDKTLFLLWEKQKTNDKPRINSRFLLCWEGIGYE